jgi:hypothetical protein
MTRAARALRGSLWLMWLTLLVAAHAAVAEARPDSRSSAAATRAGARVRSVGHVVSTSAIASDDSTGSQDEKPSNAALAPEAARAARHAITRLTRGQSDPGDCRSPAARRSPRAPPIPVSL